MEFGFTKLNILVTALFLINANVARCDNSNIIKKVDDYVLNQQSNCYQSKQLVSCFRYRIAKTVWSFATGRMNLFAQENDLEGAGGIRVVRLADPEKSEMFPESRHSSGSENEVSRAIKFIKRSINTFIGFHGVKMGLGNESGARLFDESDSFSDSRKIKKRKLSMIFPLAILIKLLHLKITLLPIILGIGIVQILLVAGGAILFHYLKNNTLCRIQPHLVHTHSHGISASESVPDVSYSAFGGYPHFSGGFGSPAYNKDWATNRAYNAYNFLDNIDSQKL